MPVAKTEQDKPKDEAVSRAVPAEPVKCDVCGRLIPGDACTRCGFTPKTDD